MQIEDRALPVLWIVVPCYYEEEALPKTAEVLSAKLASIVSSGRASEKSRICFVNDGSADRTWEIIVELHERDPRFTGISFAHNEGHQNALYAGLMHALDHGCDCAVSMDADLQDDVNAVDEMLERFAEGSEIVYGVRSKRDTDTAFKRWTARRYYRLMEKMGTEVVYDSADYRLMGSRALAALAQYDEVNLFLRGIVPTLGFKTSKVYYRRGERVAGESKYPLKKMIDFAIQGITSFSVEPMRVITKVGLFAVLVAILIFVYVIVSMATGRAVTGWASTILSIWFIGGLLMVSMGVMGEYVGKTYLESKRRPRYLIEKDLDADGASR